MEGFLNQVIIFQFQFIAYTRIVPAGTDCVLINKEKKRKILILKI